MISRAVFIRNAVVCGLGAREALMMTPGEAFDQFELFRQANRRKEDD